MQLCNNKEHIKEEQIIILSILKH